jgi:hypothetical protein
MQEIPYTHTPLLFCVCVCGRGIYAYLWLVVDSVYSRLATRYWRSDSTAPPQRVRAQLSPLLLLLIGTLLGFVPRRQQPKSAFRPPTGFLSGTEIYLFFNQHVCLLCRVGVIATPMCAKWRKWTTFCCLCVWRRNWPIACYIFTTSHVLLLYVSRRR